MLEAEPGNYSGRRGTSGRTPVLIVPLKIHRLFCGVDSRLGDVLVQRYGTKDSIVMCWLSEDKYPVLYSTILSFPSGKEHVPPDIAGKISYKYKYTGVKADLISGDCKVHHTIVRTFNASFWNTILWFILVTFQLLRGWQYQTISVESNDSVTKRIIIEYVLSLPPKNEVMLWFLLPTIHKVFVLVMEKYSLDLDISETNRT